MKPRLDSFLKDFYKDYSVEVDQEIFLSLMQLCKDNLKPQYLPTDLKEKNLAELTQNIYQSDFSSYEKAMKVLDMPTKQAVEMIKKDAAYQLANEWNEIVKSNVNPKYEKNKRQIDSLQAIYMKAQMDLFPEKKFYPDANSTLRLTYGKVQGYKPKDAVSYTPVTYLDGVMEKYVPGDYEFDVSKKLITLHDNKDYGDYADATGGLPVCFIGSNHTTGGNSGSPALDARGNLIGLNFDRTWEGTMSDINYDPSICRNIMVDARYVLFVIDKFGRRHKIGK